MRADPVATLAALDPLMASGRSDDWHETLRPIAEHFQLVASTSVPFAARVIKAAFTKEYDQEDRFNLGGRLLPLAFSKKDSLDMVRRSIGMSLGDLASRRPRTAVHLIVLMMRLVVAQKRRTNQEKPEAFQVLFRGARATIIQDYSVIWGDRNYNRHEAWYPALSGLQKALVQMGSDRSKGTRIDAVLDVFARYARPAITWNALLRGGASAPQLLGTKLFELLLSPGVLTGYDTEVAAGQLLTASWSYLSAEQRAQIEHAILSLPGNDAGEETEWLRRDRDRLLGCIPKDSAESPEARAALAEIHLRGEPPRNEPSFSIGTARSISEEERLRIHGVDTESPNNREVLDLTKRLQEAKPSNGQRFAAGEVGPLLSTMSALRSLLSGAPSGGLHREITDRAEGVTYDVLAKVAQTDGMSPDHHGQIRRLLLDASRDPRPATPQDDEQKKAAGFAGWGGGQPSHRSSRGADGPYAQSHGA